MPRQVARRFPGLGAIAADGHVLAGLGVVGLVVPGLVLASGLAIGTFQFGFETTFTEALPIMVAALVLGTISTQLGALFAIGFSVGNFLLANSNWTSEVRSSRVTGILAHPLVANLVLERGPLLIQYALLFGLAVAVPLAARSLAGSVSSRLRLPDTVHLVVAGVLIAIAAFVVARFWASAAPVVIRPVFTWSPESGINRMQPPAGAIEPIQENETWIARWAAIAVLIRIALIWWIPRSESRRRRVETVELRLLEPIETERENRSLANALWTSFAYAVIGVLLLAGIFTDLWVAAAVAAVFFVARLAKLGTIPLPTRGWRSAVARIPVLVRFGFAVLVMNGVAKAVFASYLSERNDFQFMAIPVVIGVILLTVLVPEANSTVPPTDPEPVPAGDEAR